MPQNNITFKLQSVEEIIHASFQRTSLHQWQKAEDLVIEVQRQHRQYGSVDTNRVAPVITCLDDTAESDTSSAESDADQIIAHLCNKQTNTFLNLSVKKK